MPQITAYINKQTSPQKEILNELRQFIKKILPQAEEGLKYGVPAFKMNGKVLMYAAFKAHVGLYPEPEVIEAFSDELKNYQTAKGTIQFKLDQPLPYELIKKIVLYKFK
jgi:uncharacterized protein YdhG (YjbR/CyaY superfamily)